MGHDIVQTCIRFPPAPGGAESHVEAISSRLAGRGHRVRILTSDLHTETPFRRYTSLPRQPRWGEVVRFPAFSAGGELHYTVFPQVLPAMLRSGADLVHAHSYGYFQVTAAAIDRYMRGRPLVFTPHFHPSWSMWGGQRRKFLRTVYDNTVARPVLRAANVIIGVSRREIALLEPQLHDGLDRVRFIPNGIDLRDFTPVPDPGPFRRHLGLVDDEPFILFAGRLATNKGLDILVEACGNLSEPTRLVLSGQDQGLGQALLQQAEKNGVRLDLVGHLSRDLLHSAFSACSVFALPSEYEAFGIVLLEAMACGRPCVATAVGGVPEVIEVGVTGELVPYGDAGAFSEALDRVLTDPGLARRLGDAGRRRVEQRFHWDVITTQIEQIYDQLLV